jgi:hypothetical protein
MTRILPRIAQSAAAAALAVAISAALSAGAAAEEMEMKLVSGLAPASPQPQASAIKPGLQATFHFTYVRSIHALRSFAEPRKGDGSQILPKLYYKFGPGNVFNTDRDNGVGAHIVGLIKFDKPGTYRFEVTSNDGIRIVIGGKLVFEDPEVHSDDTSDPIPVKIDKPGWYPLDVWYYERKGTSTIQVRWKLPGQAGEFVPVPASAFGHVPQ